jgi:hypothetical protein
MSLIEEALRRAQKAGGAPREQQAAKGHPAQDAEAPLAVHSWPTTAGSPAPDAAMGHRWLVSATAWAVIGMTLVLLIGGSFWMGRLLTEQRQRISAQAATPSAAPPAPPVPQRQEEERPLFTLTGIVAGGGAPYAVINEAILSVGDRIGPATLTQIAKGAATLRLDDGRELTLRVPR